LPVERALVRTVWPRRLLRVAVVAAVLGAALWLPLPWTVSTRVAHRAQIARPPAQVYGYVTTPVNWPRWHPSSLAVSGAIDHSLQIGEQATEQFQVAGRHGSALWRVTALEYNRSWTIVGTIRGRVAGQVTYRIDALKPAADAAAPISETTGTTRFEREFVYYAPNLLFVLLDYIKINSVVDDESRRAVANLKHVLESAQRR
jgi:uncharacterized protein YndB with AHSA1/START domain